MAVAVFARLGLSFSPPPQPELQTRTEEQGDEGTRTTDGVWADGSLAVRLRSVSQWWGSTTTTSGGAGSYVMELSGLPGDARATLNGASTLSSYRVKGPAEPVALVEAALLAEVADRLAREATWLPHPSVPRAHGMAQPAAARPLEPAPVCSAHRRRPFPPAWCRTLRGLEASGLFGPPVPGGEVEEVTVWRAGSWTLREARVYERARLARADVALQREPGGAWALFQQFTAPPAWMPDHPGASPGSRWERACPASSTT